MLDLGNLESKLDKALNNESKASLKQWLLSERLKEIRIYLLESVNEIKESPIISPKNLLFEESEMADAENSNPDDNYRFAA